MKKLTIISAVVLLAAGAVWGTEEEPSTVFSEYPNAVGFFASSDAGAGLSYQRWFGRLGFSVMAGIVYYPDEFYYSRSLDYSVYPVNPKYDDIDGDTVFLIRPGFDNLAFRHGLPFRRGIPRRIYRPGLGLG
ncbi:MAG: hypothetical protein ACLFSE_02475 [Spirochaetia bacterium]